MISDSAKLYTSRVTRSEIGERCSIGDGTKVIDSILRESVTIDRYNHIDSSTFGKYSYTGKNTTILHTQIGAFCSISWNVTIGGANHDYRRICQHPILYNESLNFVTEPIYDRYAAPLIIGSDVWIGCGAVVLRGVKVGNGAVIGANSVVTKDVPPFAIVAGNPAKILKYRFTLSEIEEVMSLRWWDWDIDKIRNNIQYLSNILGVEENDSI